MALLWNSDYQLGRFLNRIGAIRRGGEVLAPCPLFEQRHPTRSHDPYKVVLSRGHTQPLLFHCRTCGRGGHEDICEAWGLSGRKETARWFAEADRDGYKPLEEVSEVEPPQLPLPVLHAAYSAAIEASPVGGDEKAARWLRERGVDAELAATLHYGYFPADAKRAEGIRAAVADRLRRDGIRVSLSQIPGFNAASDLRGPAIAIPSRAECGSIQGIKLRLLASGKYRMRQLSSKASGGAAAVNRLHFAARPTSGGDLYLTEGERKADVLQHRRVKGEGVVVAVPGTDNRRLLFDWLGERRFAWKSITLAFDLDWEGTKCRDEVEATLKRDGGSGLLLRRLEWRGHKGVDEAVIAGADIRLTLSASPTTSCTALKAASSLRRVDLNEALSRGPWKLKDFDAAFPSLKQQLRAAIDDGRAAMRKYAGIGPVVAAKDTPEERWLEAAKSLSVAGVR